MDAVNAGDLARLLTLVAEDVIFLTPGHAPSDREGFSSNFATAHQQMRIGCTSELEEVIVVGEVAYTRGRDALSVTPRAGGKAAQFAGHRMTVYRKLRDGRWLLSRDVHTLSAAWPNTAPEQRRLCLEVMDGLSDTTIIEFAGATFRRRASALDRYTHREQDIAGARDSAANTS